MKKDKLDNYLKIGDYFALEMGSLVVGRIYGFKKDRMHYLRYNKDFGISISGISISYTTRYDDCVKLHEDHVPAEMKKSLEPQYNDLSRKMTLGII
jgi:hypothetical protein